MVVCDIYVCAVCWWFDLLWLGVCIILAFIFGTVLCVGLRILVCVTCGCSVCLRCVVTLVVFMLVAMRVFFLLRVGYAGYALFSLMFECVNAFTFCWLCIFGVWVALFVLR